MYMLQSPGNKNNKACTQLKPFTSHIKDEIKPLSKMCVCVLHFSIDEAS